VQGVLHAFRSDVGYYEERADGLLASALDRTEPAAAAFARHGAPLTPDGARAVVAAEHGSDGWDAFVRGLPALTDAPFARAYRRIEAHDVEGLRAQLDAHPDLVRARGTNGNDLLGFASATCDERLVGLLLERGADPLAANVHGWTALHQAAYSGLPALVDRLLAAGGRLDVFARGDGGTPLVVALFWGHRAAAERLAAGGVHPVNLRAAAGLGRLDLIDAVLADGTAGAHRGFYRPHSGFPPWTPSDDRQEALDEALAWAARNDRAGAIERLAGHGADVAADVYRGTPLAWAAATGRVAAIRALAALGADPNQRATFGGPSHGEGVTALHLAAQNGHLGAIEALLELGADAALTDALYDATPAGWAEHGGHREAAERLRVS
jgi:ankyrin repeat protein